MLKTHNAPDQLPLPQWQQSFNFSDEEWAALMMPQPLNLEMPFVLNTPNDALELSNQFQHQYQFQSWQQQLLPYHHQQHHQHQHLYQQHHQQQQPVGYVGYEAGGFGVAPQPGLMLDEFGFGFSPADPPFDDRRGWYDFFTSLDDDNYITSSCSGGDVAAAAPLMGLEDGFGLGDCFSSISSGWRVPGLSDGGMDMGFGSQYGGVSVGLGLGSSLLMDNNSSSNNGGGGYVAETL